jgi:hypothetical protein
VSSLAASPQELRSASRALANGQAELDRLAGCGRRAPCGTAQWWGLAAFEQQARTESLVSVLDRTAGPLGELSRAVDRLAWHCEQTQHTVLRLTAQRDAAAGERVALIAAPVDPTDLAAVARRAARIGELDRLLERIEIDRCDAEGALDAVCRQVQGQVEGSWPQELAQDLRTLGEVGFGVFKVYSGARQIGTGVQLLRLSVRYAGAIDLRLRLELLIRIRGLVTAVGKVPWWASRLGPFGALVVPLTVFPPAWADLRDGGGYQGTRGTITRITAALAIPGSVAIALPVPSAHLKAFGAITVGAYGAWKGGSYLYDNPEITVLLGHAAWHEAKRRAGEIGDLIGPTPGMPWGPLGPLGPVIGTEPGRGWVRDRAEDLIDDLPELPDQWARSVRQLGEPIRLGDLPIAPGPRLPAVPTLPFIDRWPGGLSLPGVPGWSG